MRDSDYKRFDEPLYVSLPYFPDISKIKQHLNDIWKNKWLTNFGEKHKILEGKIKNKLNANNFSLCSSGTMALVVSLKALDLEPGGEVITTPFTFAATAHAISAAGLQPVFVDVDSKTGTIDVNEVRKRIGKKTVAILAVHIYGVPCDIDELESISKDNGLKLIFDASHAFGGKYKDKSLALYGDASTYSFHATKLFHSVEGGGIACRDINLKNRIDALCNFGMLNGDKIVLPGVNGKLSELHAAVGIECLDGFDEEVRKRKIVRETYFHCLDGMKNIRMFNVDSKDFWQMQYFPIIVNSKSKGLERDKLFEFLKSNNVLARKYFYPLCSNFPHYKNSSSTFGGELKNSEFLANAVLCLPFYGGLEKEQIHNICKMLYSFSRKDKELVPVCTEEESLLI